MTFWGLTKDEIQDQDEPKAIRKLFDDEIEKPLGPSDWINKAEIVQR